LKAPVTAKSRKNTKPFLKAQEAIDREHFLLVFPVKNQSTPRSLWSVLHPRSVMRWEWDDSGDTRLFDLWRLREELSQSGKVVYGKYYKNRATFFSKLAFERLLSAHQSEHKRRLYKHGAASEILSLLEDTSPLSTKQIKKLTQLQGKFHERTFQSAMKNLWEDKLIVGWGESDDGAFPSLRVGATSSLFEDLWQKSQKRDRHESRLWLCDQGLEIFTTNDST
jgi:hypothetical protein